MSANPESPDRGRPQRADGREKTAKKRSALYSVLEIVGIVVAAFVIAMFVQAFLFKPFTVHQVSMQPTLIEGDRILINRVIYHFRDPQVGRRDRVPFARDGGEDLVKRMVAVAGDQCGGPRWGPVRQRREEGRALSQGAGLQGSVTRRRSSRRDKCSPWGTTATTAGTVSLFGPIDKDSIIGEAFVIYWPIGHWSGV